MSLHLWPSLTLAVQNHWGGPDSEDKRDWFAGAIAELFPDLSTSPAALAALRSSKQQSVSKSNGSGGDTTTEEPDLETVEEVLLQVMFDEFEVNVEDESAFSVAEQIIRLRKQCAKGKFDEVEELSQRYQARKDKALQFTRGKDQESEDDAWEDGSEDNDIEMDEAPPLAPTLKEKPDPEVDEDGFTKVTRKKR